MYGIGLAVWAAIGRHVAKCDGCDRCKGVSVELRGAISRLRRIAGEVQS